MVGGILRTLDRQMTILKVIKAKTGPIAGDVSVQFQSSGSHPSTKLVLPFGRKAADFLLLSRSHNHPRAIPKFTVNILERILLTPDSDALFLLTFLGSSF